MTLFQRCLDLRQRRRSGAISAQECEAQQIALLDTSRTASLIGRLWEYECPPVMSVAGTISQLRNTSLGQIALVDEIPVYVRASPKPLKIGDRLVTCGLVRPVALMADRGICESAAIPRTDAIVYGWVMMAWKIPLAVTLAALALRVYGANGAGPQFRVILAAACWYAALSVAASGWRSFARSYNQLRLDRAFRGLLGETD
jgi:hypothetical protein